MPQTDRIAVCIPSRGLVYSEMVESVVYAIDDFRFCNPGIEVMWLFQHYTPMPDCRVELVEKAMRMGCSHIWFVDDDMKVPENALVDMYAHDVDIVSGLCWNKSRADSSKPMIGFENANYPIVSWTDRWYWPHFFKIHGCGLACCLIKTAVFKKMAGDWFDWDWTYSFPKPNGKVATQQIPQGEDLYFCYRARAEGFDIWCDSGVIVKHMLFHYDGDSGNGRGYNDAAYSVEYFPHAKELEPFRIGNPDRLVIVDTITPQEYWKPHFKAQREWIGGAKT